MFFPRATDLFSDSFATVVHGGEECITLQVSAARQRQSTLSESKNSSHSRLPGQDVTRPIIKLPHFSCESHKSLRLHTLGRRMDARFFILVHGQPSRSLLRSGVPDAPQKKKPGFILCGTFGGKDFTEHL